MHIDQLKPVYEELLATAVRAITQAFLEPLENEIAQSEEAQDHLMRVLASMAADVALGHVLDPVYGRPAAALWVEQCAEELASVKAEYAQLRSICADLEVRLRQALQDKSALNAEVSELMDSRSKANEQLMQTQAALEQHQQVLNEIFVSRSWRWAAAIRRWL